MQTNQEIERHYLAKDYLRQAATIVSSQAAEYPTLGIPVDPDVAEHMGAFEERALDDSDDGSSSNNFPSDNVEEEETEPAL